MVIVKILFDERKNGFLFTSEDDETFLVSYETYLRLNLHAPCNPSLEQEKILREEDARFRAASLALSYASYQPRTEHEVLCRLQREKIAPDAAEAAVAKLRREGWLDDASYAKRYGEDKLRKGWSLRHIAGGLRQKGIDAARIRETLSSFHQDEESETLRRLAQKKYGRRDLSDSKEFERTVQALCRRGFPLEAVLRVLKEMRET